MSLKPVIAVILCLWMMNAKNAVATPTGRVYCYVKDHLGSTRTVVDASNGQVVENIAYYPFGKVMKKDMLSYKSVTEKYTGQEFDEDGADPGLGIRGLELAYHHARYYDPEVGHWVGQDPLREYSSPYCYVGGNPVLYVDPSGLAHEISADEWQWRAENNAFDQEGQNDTYYYSNGDGGYSSQNFGYNEWMASSEYAGSDFNYRINTNYSFTTVNQMNSYVNFTHQSWYDGAAFTGTGDPGSEIAGGNIVMTATGYLTSAASALGDQLNVGTLQKLGDFGTALGVTATAMDYSDAMMANPQYSVNYHGAANIQMGFTALGVLVGSYGGPWGSAAGGVGGSYLGRNIAEWALESQGIPLPSQ